MSAAACLLWSSGGARTGTGSFVHGRAHVFAYTLLSGIVLLALCARASSDGRLSSRRASLADSCSDGIRARVGNRPRLARRAACTDAGGTALGLREPFLRRSEPLALGFPHDKHAR